MAKLKITPFLWYAKDAEAAAKLYTSVFPDSRIDRVTPMQAESPSGPPGSVVVVDFTLCGQPFIAMTAGSHAEFNDAMSLYVSCDTQAELDRYWNGLIDGGGKPVACGWLNDRFGVRWQITPSQLVGWLADPDKAKARRVAEAMMKMVKLDVAQLEAAYKG